MRKALVLGIAACGFLYAMPVSAQECSNAVQLIMRNQQNPGASKANMANPMVLCPRDIDANGDGVISRQEWQDAILNWHTDLDENGDGSLSTDEINRLQPGDF